MPRPIRKRLHPKVANSNAVDDSETIQEDEHLKEADTVGLRARVETHLDSPLRDISNTATKQLDEDDDPFGFSKVEREIKQHRTKQLQAPRVSSPVTSPSPPELNDHKEPSSDDSFLSMSDVREAEQRKRSLRVSSRVAAISTPVSDRSFSTGVSSSGSSNLSSKRGPEKQAAAEAQPTKRRKAVKTKELTALLPKRRNKTLQDKAPAALLSSDDIVCSDHEEGESSDSENTSSRKRPARKAKESAVNKVKNIGAKRGRLPMVKNAPRDNTPRCPSNPSDGSVCMKKSIILS